MSAPQTENRRKKMKILRECYDLLLDLMLYKDIQRDRVNMARFKELQRKVNEMHRTANFGESDAEKFTRDNEKESAMDSTQQDNLEEVEFKEK